VQLGATLVTNGKHNSFADHHPQNSVTSTTAAILAPVISTHQSMTPLLPLAMPQQATHGVIWPLTSPPVLSAGAPQPLFYHHHHPTPPTQANFYSPLVPVCVPLAPMAVEATPDIRGYTHGFFGAINQKSCFRQLWFYVRSRTVPILSLHRSTGFIGGQRRYHQTKSYIFSTQTGNLYSLVRGTNFGCT